jgi:hypothetical protein
MIDRKIRNFKTLYKYKYVVKNIQGKKRCTKCRNVFSQRSLLGTLIKVKSF